MHLKKSMSPYPYITQSNFTRQKVRVYKGLNGWWLLQLTAKILAILCLTVINLLLWLKWKHFHGQFFFTTNRDYNLSILRLTAKILAVLRLTVNPFETLINGHLEIIASPFIPNCNSFAIKKWKKQKKGKAKLKFIRI